MLRHALFSFAALFAFACQAQASGLYEVKSEKEFDELVKNSGVPVVVDLSAEWCYWCKVIQPKLEKIQDKVGNSALILHVDVDKLPGVASRFPQRGIPDLHCFRDGKEVASFLGGNQDPSVAKWIAGSLAAKPASMNPVIAKKITAARKVAEQAKMIAENNPEFELNLRAIQNRVAEARQKVNELCSIVARRFAVDFAMDKMQSHEIQVALAAYDVPVFNEKAKRDETIRKLRALKDFLVARAKPLLKKNKELAAFHREFLSGLSLLGETAKLDTKSKTSPCYKLNTEDPAVANEICFDLNTLSYDKDPQQFLEIREQYGRRIDAFVRDRNEAADNLFKLFLDHRGPGSTHAERIEYIREAMQRKGKDGLSYAACLDDWATWQNALVVEDSTSVKQGEEKLIENKALREDKSIR